MEDVLTGGVRSGLDLDTLIITVNGNTIPIPSNPDLTIIEIKDPNDVLVELEIEYRCPYNIINMGTNTYTMDIKDKVKNSMIQISNHFDLP